MFKFILRWAINAVALYVAVLVVPGVHLATEDWTAFVWLALIFGLLNAIIRPILKLVAFPLFLLTFGLIVLLINTVMFFLTEWVANNWFDIAFSIDDFWAAFLGALVVSVVTIVLSKIFKDELKGRKR
jgi:putative membrane protein